MKCYEVTKKNDRHLQTLKEPRHTKNSVSTRSGKKQVKKQNVYCICLKRKFYVYMYVYMYTLTHTQTYT